MITSSYRPGSWFGVFGVAATLLLPSSEKARVAGLWSLIDDGAGFDEVLDALLQTGLGTLPGFVLVAGGEGPTKILARGPVLVTATADGEVVRIDGRDALTWVERTLDGVSSLSIRADEPSEPDQSAAPSESGADDGDVPGTPDLPILGGLVRVSRVDAPAVAGDVTEPTDLPAHAPGSDPLGGDPLGDDPLDDDLPPLPPIPPAPPVPPSAPMPPSTPLPPAPPAPLASGPLDEPTYIPSSIPSSLPPAPPPGGTTGDLEGDPLADPLTEPLDLDAGPEPDTGPEEAADHDGMTRTGTTGAEEFDRQLPGIPGQPQAPKVVPAVAKLAFSSGDVVDVDRVILVGRAPEARRFTSTEQPRLVKVPSPLYEISSTHLEVRPGSGADHGSAVVTDMGSTNGTVVDQPGLGPESLKPGIAVQLIPGATINLGDGVTIQVTRP